MSTITTHPRISDAQARVINDLRSAKYEPGSYTAEPEQLWPERDAWSNAQRRVFRSLVTIGLVSRGTLGTGRYRGLFAHVLPTGETVYGEQYRLAAHIYAAESEWYQRRGWRVAGSEARFG